MTILKSVLVGSDGLVGSAKCGIILIMIYGCVTFWIFADEMQVHFGVWCVRLMWYFRQGETIAAPRFSAFSRHWTLDSMEKLH